MLLNALVHRNYMGAPIQIRIYDDKISIWNEGLLPEGLSLDALKKSHPSRPRNPIIADVCFKGGYIDAWGRGTIKIIESCRKFGLSEPEMLELDGGFSMTLIKNTVKSKISNLSELNDRQIRAISFIEEKGAITNKEYQEINNISERTASRELADLVEKRKLKSSGVKGAGAYYILYSE